jgi:hypothetical protein
MNRPATFKQSEVTKAVKGAVAAGLKVGRIEIAGGHIVIVPADAVEAEASPLDAWRASRVREG